MRECSHNQVIKMEICDGYYMVSAILLASFPGSPEDSLGEPGHEATILP